MLGRNPLLPVTYRIPDAEARVMPDGKVYLYGSLDQYEDSFCSDRYIVASCDQSDRWEVTAHPSFLTKEVPWAVNSISQKHSSLADVHCFEELPAHIRQQLPESAKNIPIDDIISAIEQHAQNGLPKEIRLYAPDAIEKEEKYYLYFCMSDDSEGVAVADSPAGPFKNARKLPVQGIDPAVFVDDDGSPYYYWGQFSANGAKLNPDMISLDEGSLVTGLLTEEEHHFHEGSSVRKRGDLYYYVFADTSRGRPTCLGYATGRHPLGPFTYRGVIIDNADCDPKSWNNHGSIEEINGQWYVFYHRSSNNSQFQRRVCCEPIFFDENGLIKEVVMTSQGAGTPLQAGEYIAASRACSFLGGAYLDTAQPGNGIIRFLPGSSAIFRFIQNDKPLTKMKTDMIGDCGILSVICDGKPAGRGESQNQININIPPGMHSLELRIEKGCAAMCGFLIT